MKLVGVIVDLKLYNFGLYSDVVRENSKKTLEYDVEKGLNNKILQFKSYYGSFSPEQLETIVDSYEIEEKYKILKSASSQLLEDDKRLKVYLDSEIRERIMHILKLISSGPNDAKFDSDDAKQKLKRIGFSDADEYLEEFNTPEEIRKDLFSQADLTYISYANLKQMEEDGASDVDVSFLYEQAGIKDDEYVANNYLVENVLQLPRVYIETLIGTDYKKVK